MPTCFVIQPFDGGPFDKRYDDVFVPAISAANLEAYRVDRDPSASIPMEEVEKGIREADACLADISEPNPNVWFELGFAIAAGKPVVLVCLEKPDRPFPFDIQHRTIITYKTESARDFENLKGKITERLTASLRKEGRLGKLAEASVVADIAGLSSLEMVALATLAENADSPDSWASPHAIRHDMEKQGFTKLAVTLGLGTLLRKKMINRVKGESMDGYPYEGYAITESGMAWLISNQDRLVLRREPLTEDDIPF